MHDPTLNTLGDPDLVRRCLAAGREKDDAFAALYTRYAARVFGFLLTLTRRREAAEDALQETFLRAYKALDRFDPQRGLLPWLLQIARFVAIDAHRVEAKVQRLEHRTAEGAPVSTPAPAVVEAAAVRERSDQVQAALAELSMDDRALLLLRHEQGLTFKEIGLAVDASPRTAQNRVEAAARRLQAKLLRRGGSS